MLIAFLTTLGEMARILMFLVVGFFLNRLHVLPKGAGAGISRLITMVLLPALLIYNNMTEFNPADIASYGKLVMLGVVCWCIIAPLVAPLAKKLSGGDPLENGVYLYGLCFANTSAVGTPLVIALMGSTGLFKFNLYSSMLIIMTYAWGIGLFVETDRKNPVKRFFVNMLNPVFISMLVGLCLGALNSKEWMPKLITNFIGDLGGCYIPVSLLLTGYTIADYPLGEIFNRPKSYIFTLFRLVLIPLFVILGAKLLGLSLELATIMLLAVAGPSGMNVVVFPASYGRDCKSGASIVLLSSLGAIITVPILYALVQLIFG